MRGAVTGGVVATVRPSTARSKSPPTRASTSPPTARPGGDAPVPLRSDVTRSARWLGDAALGAVNAAVGDYLRRARQRARARHDAPRGRPLPRATSRSPTRSRREAARGRLRPRARHHRVVVVRRRGGALGRRRGEPRHPPRARASTSPPSPPLGNTGRHVSGERPRPRRPPRSPRRPLPAPSSRSSSSGTRWAASCPLGLPLRARCKPPLDGPRPPRLLPRLAAPRSTLRSSGVAAAVLRASTPRARGSRARARRPERPASGPPLPASRRRGVAGPRPGRALRRRLGGFRCSRASTGTSSPPSPATRAHPVGRFVGDLLVRVESASGPASRAAPAARHLGAVLHHELQNHPPCTISSPRLPAYARRGPDHASTPSPVARRRRRCRGVAPATPRRGGGLNRARRLH